MRESWVVRWLLEEKVDVQCDVCFDMWRARAINLVENTCARWHRQIVAGSEFLSKINVYRSSYGFSA